MTNCDSCNQKIMKGYCHSHRKITICPEDYKQVPEQERNEWDYWEEK